MKTTLLILMLFLSTPTFCQLDTISFKKHDWKFNNTETKYKPGFTYYANGGMMKVTLIKWVDCTYKPKPGEDVDPFFTKPQWRWEATYELLGMGHLEKGYADDLTIDLETGKLIRWNGQIYEPVELRNTGG